MSENKANPYPKTFTFQTENEVFKLILNLPELNDDDIKVS